MRSQYIAQQTRTEKGSRQVPSIQPGHQLTHWWRQLCLLILSCLNIALPPWVKCWIWTLQKPPPAGDVRVTQVLFCVIALFGLWNTSSGELFLSFSLSLFIITLGIHSVFFFNSYVRSHRRWITVTQTLLMCFLCCGVCVGGSFGFWLSIHTCFTDAWAALSS